MMLYYLEIQDYLNFERRWKIGPVDKDAGEEWLKEKGFHRTEKETLWFKEKNIGANFVEIISPLEKIDI